MPDYSKGQIYMLECDGLIYVGSTIQILKERKQAHKSNWKRWKSGKGKYCSSFELLDKNKPVNIILLLEYPCNSNRELQELEQHYINEIDCVNTIRSFITKEERKAYIKENQLNNKELIKEYQKKYRLKNKELLIEYNRQYKLNKKVKILNRQLKS